MSRLNVKFKDPKEVADFVNRVEKYPYAMDLSRGSVVVDAKSLMGILVLGLGQVVSLQIYADECSQLRQELAPYIAV